MGKKMKSAPVYFTIGQVQHNPLLNLGSYLPAIQERMRKAGYPDFKRAMQVQFDLSCRRRGKRDPASRLEQQILTGSQAVARLPKAKQHFVSQMLDTAGPGQPLIRPLACLVQQLPRQRPLRSCRASRAASSSCAACA